MPTVTASRLIALLTWLVGCAITSAQPSAALPLEGNYRPGRFMPVVVAPGSDRAAHPFDGARIPGVAVEAGNPSARVVAIPVQSRPDQESGGLAATSSFPADAWHEVPPERVFLGVVDSTPLPPGLDVGHEPAVSQLDRSLLAGSTACAWDALDWLVIGPDTAAVLGDQWLGELIATGTGVCVSGRSPPDSRLPWRAIEGGWVLCAPSAGAWLGPWAADAYLPAQTWQPRQPPEFRRQVVAVAVGVAGMLLGCAMLRGRRRVVATLVVAAGATAGIAVWSFSAPPAAVVQASILVNGEVIRADHWVFVGGLSGGRVRIPWRNGLMPVFASRQQAASVRPQLVYDGGKPVAYECMLSPGQTLALRWQSLLPRESVGSVQPLTASAMRAVAEAYYLQPGWTLQGQLISAGDEQWPALVVAKRP